VNEHAETEPREWAAIIAGETYRLRIPRGLQDVRRIREAFPSDGSIVDQSSVAAASLGVAFDGVPPWGAFDASARADIVGYGDRVIEYFETRGAVYREAVACGFETFTRLIRALPNYPRIEQIAGN
jgi:hypothetical protein